MSATKKITRFGPALPDLGKTPLNQFFDQYNFLGYDNGDGEIACHKVGYDANKKKLYTIPLTFRKETPLYHVPNMLVFQNPQEAELTDIFQNNFSGTIYHNFKRCPGPKANATYRGGDNVETPYTYGTLMAHSFACAIRKLAECNVSFDIKKPTVIMVGRPSSKGWKDAEQDYANLLGSKLETYLHANHGSITILVLSESSAAMAGAVDLKQKDWLGAVTYILDLGSSTFDLTTATPEGIPPAGEDSFQFGGNQLDKAIANYGDSRFEIKYPQNQGYRMATDIGKVTKLRFKKEMCYGDNGSNLRKKQEPYTYYVMQKDASGEYRQVIDEEMEDEVSFSFPVSQKTMSSILNNEKNLDNLSCVTEQLGAFHTRNNHHSWLDACKFVMQQFYTRTEQFRKDFPDIPHRLILTGGVSNMPEVQEAAREVFHVDTVMISEEPSQTVSKGLALILGNEIVKKSILLDLEQELVADGSGLPDANSLLDQLVREVSDSEIKYYGAVIRRWAQKPGDSSIRDCIRDLGDQANDLFDPSDNFAERACRNWFETQHVAAEVERMLRNKLRQLFPEFPIHFHPQIIIPDMQDTPQKNLSNEFWINLYMFFDENDCPSVPFESLDDSLRTDQRKKILDTFYHHSSALVLGTGEHRYPGGYCMRIDNSGRISGRAQVDGVDVLESIDSVYRRQLSLEKDAEPLRKKILEMLKPQIYDFVESLTYYLAIDHAGVQGPHKIR